MSYDFDLFVIGAGSGGVRAARFAASFGAKVAVAESRYLGGTCVNVGCVPKKLLVYSAHFSSAFTQAADFGWQLAQAHFDWATLIANKNREIQRLHGIYHILLATGGWPQKPEIPGIEHAITSNEAFFLKQLPKRILVVGGGYIAVEFASIFHGLGAKTSLLYRGELFLRGFDMAVRSHLQAELGNSGMDLQFNSDIVKIDKQADGSLLATLQDGRVLATDAVFYATGRRPMLDNLGLENTQVRLDKRGYVQVDELYQTAEPSILAIGDMIGRVQLTPVALAEGMAVARRLFKPEEYRAVDYQLIPTAVFSLPNIGTVGLSEEQARAAGHRLQVFESRFRPMQESLGAGQQKTLKKLVVDAATDRVLGCHMVGPDAGEIIQGMAVALKAGASKQIFDETLGIHPTAAEEFVTMRTPRN